MVAQEAVNFLLPFDYAFLQKAKPGLVHNVKIKLHIKQKENALSGLYIWSMTLLYAPLQSDQKNKNTSAYKTTLVWETPFITPPRVCTLRLNCILPCIVFVLMFKTSFVFALPYNVRVEV